MSPASLRETRLLPSGVGFDVYKGQNETPTCPANMKFELKILSREAVARSLEKAERYRLLNEPREAESICLDVLEREPDNQEVLKTLLLALTDQFGREESQLTIEEARKIVPRLRDEYDRAYYTGIIWERLAKAQLRDSGRAFERLREAMSWFEKAEAIRPPGNDDSILRWNTCARLIMRDLA
jgi:tetratricopeptide (TPR) repeat protein